MEMLQGKNGSTPSKVFGCMCFVKDNKSTGVKLDPITVKCIFIGYSSIQNGYVCYSSVERRLFVDVDMTFRENES
jgi:hypothetical protein